MNGKASVTKKFKIGQIYFQGNFAMKKKIRTFSIITLKIIMNLIVGKQMNQTRTILKVKKLMNPIRKIIY